MLLSFLDESWNHNLDITKLDNIYNLFVLGAVCFRENAYEVFDREFRALKVKHFGNDDYVLHTVEITRPTKARDSRPRQFNDPEFRNSFYGELNELIGHTECSIIVCAVDKSRLLQQYVSPDDPYHFSFENIVNRTLGKAGQGGMLRLLPENRDNPEGRRFEIRLLDMKISWTRFYKGADVAKKIDEFRFVRKHENLSGSQLADLVVTPIGRHLLGKAPRPWNEVSYEVIKCKISRPDDFTVFP